MTSPAKQTVAVRYWKGSVNFGDAARIRTENDIFIVHGYIVMSAKSSLRLDLHTLGSGR